MALEEDFRGLRSFCPLYSPISKDGAVWARLAHFVLEIFALDIV